MIARFARLRPQLGEDWRLEELRAEREFGKCGVENYRDGREWDDRAGPLRRSSRTDREGGRRNKDSEQGDGGLSILLQAAVSTTERKSKMAKSTDG